MKIRINNIFKEYKLGKYTINALNGISLSVQSGEFICLAGPSGSGKTTFLNLIGCLDYPNSGEILFDNENVALLKEKKREIIRKNDIGLIFQSYAIIETLNVFENIEYPAIGKNYNQKEMREKINFLLERVGLIDQKKRFPNSLSGGQRQRVAIARALINKPQIVLADEPTANLDSATGAKIIDLMKKLNEDNNTSFIFSTHDPYIMNQAKRIIRIHDGKIESEGADA